MSIFLLILYLVSRSTDSEKTIRQQIQIRHLYLQTSGFSEPVGSCIPGFLTCPHLSGDVPIGLGLIFSILQVSRHSTPTSFRDHSTILLHFLSRALHYPWYHASVLVQYRLSLTTSGHPAQSQTHAAAATAQGHLQGPG